MRKNNFLITGICLALALLLFLPFFSAYAKSSVQSISPGILPSGFSSSGGQWVADRTMCEAGQDFIVQIPPFGCEPLIVRSDLLEEQNSPVLCKLAVTQINPLLKVQSIDSITFAGTQLPPEISGIGFFPAQAALGVKEKLNSPVLDNIGYVTIVLKKQPNASAMPAMISGNLTATLKYNIKEAYGLGDSKFYLSEIPDERSWENSMKNYGFWNGKGYLRAESINSESARISIYTGTNTKLNTLSLSKGESSPEIYLPGFDCLVGAKLKLEDLVSPDTRAILDINGDTVQVNAGEKFLDNKCTLKTLSTRGLTKKAEIYCTEDAGTNKFELVLTPRVSLKIGAETQVYDVGDKLYDGMLDKGLLNEKIKVTVYLAYAGTKGDSGKLEDLYVMLVSKPEDSSKLSASEIASYAGVAESDYSNIYRDKAALIKIAADLGAGAKNWITAGVDSLAHSKNKEYVFYKKEGDVSLISFSELFKSTELFDGKFADKEISVMGFASPIDSTLTQDGPSSINYKSASQDYSKVITSFGAEKDPLNSVLVLGEESFSNNINYAFILNQYQEVKRLCTEFKSTYPAGFEKEKYIPTKKICQDISRLSSATSSTKDLSINSNQKRISLMDVREPSFEEYGVKLKVTRSGSSSFIDLTKGKTNFLNDISKPEESVRYVQLVSIEGDSIKININRPKVGVVDTYLTSLYSGNTETLKKGFPSSFATEYTFEIVEIYEKKNAKVSVIAAINRAQTQSNFSFNIGIEQRSIKLSPEQVKERIVSLNKTISDWRGINDKLTKVVEGMKGACLATGLALTMKNFVSNTGGASIARQKVMMDSGGWNAKCADMVAKKTKDTDNGNSVYTNPNECIMANNAKIEEAVKKTTQTMNAQDEIIKGIQVAKPECKNKGKGLFFEEVWDTECLKKDLSKQVSSELNGISKETFKVGNDNIPISEIIPLIDANKVSVEDLKNIQLYARLKSSGLNLDLPKTSLDKTLAEVFSSNKQELESKNAIKASGVTNIPDSQIPFISTVKDSKTGDYFGKKYGDLMGDINICSPGDEICKQYGIEKSTPAQSFTTDNGKYYLALLNKQGTRYSIKNLYDINAKKMLNAKETTDIGNLLSFVLVDEGSYSNEYKGSLGSTIQGPLLRCYDTAPYKGYPSIAPVNTKTGWYVAISQNLPIGGNIASFQDSGKVMSYSLCNVWEGGIEENGKGNDKCTGINLNTGQPLNQIGGLDAKKASELVAEATKVIEAAQKKCLGGPTNDAFYLGPNAKQVRMGAPAANNPDMQCTNFMSPEDCKILFNVCDPVICPSSRCNYGGTYTVKDVVASGILGSIVLCLPNFIGTGGDIYIPICLSGIKAGIDSFLSVLEAYRDCLQNNLETGQMTGICDQIYSVHMCELVWRQALPLAKMIIPKTIELMMGKSSRGGGEYLNVQNAWTTAGKSADYFAQYYSAEAFTSFKTKIVQGVTDQVCKTYISGAYPDGGKIIDSLTNADSPPQFTGSFEEISYTTATNPAISQYKVFYHIYAGQKSRVYYQVYLTDVAESSFYQDTVTKLVVATGYIEPNGKETQTKDFTAVSGYKKMCITINGQEECGFGQTSTSFALDFVADQYVKEQANETGITSESTCVSGTPSAWSLATTNIEGAIDEVANPKIYNRGIIRICATDNPGSSTDKNAANPRWVSVGYCGEKTLKCWLDKESVKSAVNFNSSAETVLKSLTDDFLKQLAAEKNYLTESQFSENVAAIEKEKDFEIKITLVNSILEKVFMNAQKGKLYLLRANAYGSIATKPENLAKESLSKSILDTTSVCVPKDTSTQGLAKAQSYLDAIKRESTFIPTDKACCSIDATKIFIEELKKNNLIEPEEYATIIGAGFGNSLYSLFTGSPVPAQTMKEVFDLLKSKYANLCVGVTASVAQVNHGQALNSFPVNDYTLKKISTYYDAHIELASKTFGVEKNLIQSLIYVESEGDSSATSKPGAKGLMQLMEATAVKDMIDPDKGRCEPNCSKYYGAFWETDPQTNIMMGTCYFACLRDVYLISNSDKNDWTNWITAYNAGPTKFKKDEGICYQKSLDECAGLVKEQKEYAGNVLKVYNTLTGTSQTAVSLGVTSEGTLDPTRTKILASAADLNGAIVKKEDVFSCYTAVMRAYTDVSCEQKLPCIYSAISGTKYNILVGDGSSQTITISSPLFVSPTSCIDTSSTLSYDDVLKKILPGDRVDFVYNEGAAHSVIFIQWVEGKEYQKAKVFDWIGPRVYRGDKGCTENYCKSYAYNEYDWSINKQPVYVIWNPSCS